MNQPIKSSVQAEPRCFRYLLPCLILLCLIGCGGSVAVPEITYYRLPPLAAQPAANALRSPIPIVVDVFLADGMYAEQALIYALDAESATLRAYHYQLWNDPPVRLMQRRLMATLGAAQDAEVIVDRLVPGVQALRIVGLLQGFERVPVGSGWKVRAAVEFRVERTRQVSPLLIESYAAEVPAADATVNASVRAMAVAIDQVFAQFTADLRKLKIVPSANDDND